MSEGKGSPKATDAEPSSHSQEDRYPLGTKRSVEAESDFTENQGSTAEREPIGKSANSARATNLPSNDEPGNSRTSPSASNGPVMLDIADFEKALLAYGRRKGFMLSLFLLITSPGILNGFHVMVYVFYRHTPKHWCSVPILEDANWTPEQIRNVSSPSPEKWSNCEYYDVDYEWLRRMGYEKALQKIRNRKRLTTRQCVRFTYEVAEEPRTSIVSEWDLVCSRLALKATVQTAISGGKLLGASFFGILADKCGRKVAFSTACCIYMVAGPIVAFTEIYHIMVAARIFLGIAGLGVYECGYSLITEICPPELRPTLGILYNYSFGFGILGIAAIGYYVRDWRKLQYCISLPALFLIIHILLIPESPRWLYYSGRKRRAWMLVSKFLPPDRKQILADHPPSDANTRETPAQISCVTNCRALIKSNMRFLKNSEFRKRLFVSWTIWCFTAMSYNALSINTDYFRLDPYLYVALSGVVELISYMLALPLIRIFGRRSASSTLLLIGASSLLFLTLVPSNMKISKLIAALLGRLCVSGVFCVVIIHLCELFPTTIRNSALGSSSTWAHFGSMFAPYLVDFFVIYGRWVPSSICSLGLFTAAFLAQTLPETRDLALYNTLQDFVARCQANPKERVSFKNCILFYSCKKCKGFHDQLNGSTTI